MPHFHQESLVILPVAEAHCIKYGGFHFRLNKKGVAYLVVKDQCQGKTRDPRIVNESKFVGKLCLANARTAPRVTPSHPTNQGLHKRQVQYGICTCTVHYIPLSRKALDPGAR